MNSSDLTFEESRVQAAREFVQTMIVVDDEAIQSAESVVESPVKTQLQTPTRRKTVHAEESRSIPQGKHGLDAKALIESAMDAGIICSVLKPKKDDDISRVVTAASRADIVCLDWEIHDDGGNKAKALIAEIVRSDEQKNGRLRLISIYTGDRNQDRILEK